VGAVEGVRVGDLVGIGVGLAEGAPVVGDRVVGGVGVRVGELVPQSFEFFTFRRNVKNLLVRWARILSVAFTGPHWVELRKKLVPELMSVWSVGPE